MNGPRLLVLLIVFAVALGSAFAILSVRGNQVAEAPALAQLAAKNYRTLSPQQSRILIRYAQREYRCLVAHGARVSTPVASRIRITMNAPGQSPREIARRQLACDPEVGPPPAQATLQARRGLVLVYLPKGCLLDPTEVPSA